MENSVLQNARYEYKPKLPPVLRRPIDNVVVQLGEATESIGDRGRLKEIFEKSYGYPVATFAEGQNGDA